MSSGFEYWRKRHLEEQNAAHKSVEKAAKEVLKEATKPKKKEKKSGRTRSSNRFN